MAIPSLTQGENLFSLSIILAGDSDKVIDACMMGMMDGFHPKPKEPNVLFNYIDFIANSFHEQLSLPKRKCKDTRPT